MLPYTLVFNLVSSLILIFKVVQLEIRDMACDCCNFLFVSNAFLVFAPRCAERLPPIYL